MQLYTFPPISDYGLIGNGCTVALVSSNGGIDWWCPERFDDNPVFSRLLDWNKGGHFSLYSKGSKQFSYLPGTNILQTIYKTSDGVLRMFTFMPYESERKEIVRILKCETGSIELFVDFKTTGGFSPDDLKNRHQRKINIELLSSVKVNDGRIVLEEGQEAIFVVQNGRYGQIGDLNEYAHQQFITTKAYWEEWISSCTYQGYGTEHVKRSILCLKLLQYSATGALVAAPTTSLPEYPGGQRNWDYRFSWIRDGVFIVMAFETLGYKDEADDFREWLTNTLYDRKAEKLQMLYAIDGNKTANEVQWDLEGYKGAQPVRIGNSAASQRQIDTYGEAMLCYHRADKIFNGPLREKAWVVVKGLLSALEEIWEEPDSGIWETQGEQQQFLYSKAVSHLAFAHGVSICENYNFEGPVEKWEELAKSTKEVVEQNFRKDISAFSATIGKKDIDGANLLFPMLGIFDYMDERMVQTSIKIREDLEAHKMIYRNLDFNHFDNPEGAFSPVTFWMSQVEAKQGKIKHAKERFENLVKHAGATGLLSEECDPVTGEMWGNYPQALTHLSLILAAWAINDEDKISFNSNNKT